jgi:energy-coupling factor transport system permease protein
MTPIVPTYRNTGSPLHHVRAGVAAAFTLAPCIVALIVPHPLVLAAALGCVIAAGAAAGVGAELRKAAWLAVPLAVMVAAINPLVSREGLTLVVQGPTVPLYGTLDITLEAIVFGAVAGLRVLVVVLAFALYSAVVDPDRVLRALHRIAPRSALTASLATRMIPLLARDAERMREAYALRADAVPASGRRARLGRAGTMTRALAAGALERAMDAAASLEVRGYGARKPRVRAVRPRLPWSRDDRAFALAAAALIAIPLALRLAGAGWFDPYPQLRADDGAAVFAVAFILPALAIAPFGAAQRRRSLRAARHSRTAHA